MRIDSKRTIAMIAGVALTACLGLAACSAENTGSNLSETGDSQANTEQVSVASGQNDPYVSDDACLGCHGGTYESVAARTESYWRFQSSRLSSWRLPVMQCMSC